MLRKMCPWLLVFCCACKKNHSDPQADSTLKNGLVAYYPFSGNAKDSSGNKNDGTVYGAVTSTDRNGNANNAYYFDGVSNYIQADSSESLSLTGDFSFSLWMKPQVSSSAAGYLTTILQYGDKQSGFDPYFLYYNFSSNTVLMGTDRVNNYPDTLLASSVRFANFWVHVTGTWNSATATEKIYVNGALVASGVFNNDASLGYSTKGFVLNIGSTDGKNVFYKGYMDEIRVYNRELTEAEAKELASL